MVERSAAIGMVAGLDEEVGDPRSVMLDGRCALWVFGRVAVGHNLVEGLSDLGVAPHMFFVLALGDGSLSLVPAGLVDIVVVALDAKLNPLAIRAACNESVVCHFILLLDWRVCWITAVRARASRLNPLARGAVWFALRRRPSSTARTHARCSAGLSAPRPRATRKLWRHHRALRSCVVGRQNDRSTPSALGVTLCSRRQSIAVSAASTLHRAPPCRVPRIALQRTPQTVAPRRRARRPSCAHARPLPPRQHVSRPPPALRFQRPALSFPLPAGRRPR